MERVGFGWRGCVGAVACAAALCVAAPAVAQTSNAPSAREYRSSLGLGRHGVLVGTADSTGGNPVDRSIGVAGVSFTHTRRPSRTFGWLIDAEVQLGLLRRGTVPAESITHLVGAHAMTGPRINLGVLPVAVHFIGGLSFVHVTDEELTTGTGSGSSFPQIYYVGGDPALRDFLNNSRSRSTPQTYYFPGSSHTSPAALAGVSAHVSRVRLSADVLRIDSDGPRWGVIRAGAGFTF